MKTLPVFGVDIGIAERPAEGTISGDSYFCRRFSPGLFAVAISDGMGTGSDASYESKLTLNLLGDFLNSGISPQDALKTLNFVLLKSNTKEIFSTLDLAIFDLTAGTVSVYKMSAAPTVMIRNGKIGIIKFPSLPLGITEDPCIRSVEFSLKRNDRLLFLSDGITEADKCDTDLEWMRKLLSHTRYDSAESICSRILWGAAMSYGRSRTDDMTVITVKIQ